MTTKIIYPDYHKSSVSLSNSICKHFHIPTKHQTLESLDAYLNKGYQHVVLMLFDGLGSKILTQHLPADRFLHKHKVDDISAVFPSATVIATTSITTGKNPSEHGWLGWFMYVKSLDKIVTTYFNTVKGTDEEVADYHVIQSEFPNETIIDAINKMGNAKAYWYSPFEQMLYDQYKLDDTFDQIAKLCKDNEKAFFYIYNTEPDNLMHQHGVDDVCITQKIEWINAKTEQLARSLEDTLIIVTADHGHINATPIFLEEYPQLQKLLLRETSIEPRATNFFIKEGMQGSFVCLFNQLFGKDFKLFTKQEVLDLQLFGSGNQHDKFESCLGDFLAVAITNKYIMDKYTKNPMKGIHGGLTEEEMMIPLIIIET